MGGRLRAAILAAILEREACPGACTPRVATAGAVERGATGPCAARANPARHGGDDPCQGLPRDHRHRHSCRRARLAQGASTTSSQARPTPSSRPTSTPASSWASPPARPRSSSPHRGRSACGMAPRRSPASSRASRCCPISGSSSATQSARARAARAGHPARVHAVPGGRLPPASPGAIPLARVLDPHRRGDLRARVSGRSSRPGPVAAPVAAARRLHRAGAVHRLGRGRRVRAGQALGDRIRPPGGGLSSRRALEPEAPARVASGKAQAGAGPASVPRPLIDSRAAPSPA